MLRVAQFGAVVGLPERDHRADRLKSLPKPCERGQN